MKTNTIVIIAILAGASHLWAADVPMVGAKGKAKARPEARDAEPNKPSTEAATPLELKTKSSFQMEGNNRNPFWPIGWKPPAKLADAGAERGGPEIPVSAFLVSSITIEKGTRFAIVNGKIMQEGQQFGLQLGNQTYQITVKTIEDGRVVLARRDQEIAIPLRRK